MPLTPLATTMTVDEAIEAGYRVVAWRLFRELVPDRTQPLPEGLRPFVFPVRMSAHLILHDPALPPGENWLRISETGQADVPLFLSAWIGASHRFYVPAEAGDGFRAEKPLYEGHWRAAFDEPSDLPWPVPDPSWRDRTAFLEELAKAESTAYHIEYRGLSYCRLCGQVNGRDGLRKDRWEWPEGLRHYIEAHDIRPTDEFVDFISRASR